MKNLQNLLEKMEQRKNNTEKAKEELFSILEKISAIIPDQINVENEIGIDMKWSYHNGNWNYYNTEDQGICNIEIRKGIASVVFYYGNYNYEPGRFDVLGSSDIDYINYHDVTESLSSLLEKLEKLTTFSNSLETLQKINGLLK